MPRLALGARTRDRAVPGLSVQHACHRRRRSGPGAASRSTVRPHFRAVVSRGPQYYAVTTRRRSRIPTNSLPNGTIAVPLSQGAVALIDAGDADQVLRYSWHLHSCGYAARARRAADGPGSRVIFMHRAILDAPPGMPVRRLTGSRLDNRRVNLRLATPLQSREGFDLRGDNTSGFRGMTRSKRDGTW